MNRLKTLMCIALAAAAAIAIARPGPYARPRPMPPHRAYVPPPHHRVHVPPRPVPFVPRHHYHAYHADAPFWVGLGVGAIGVALSHAIAPAPTAVVAPPPVVVRNPVWVPPVYETRPVYDAYGQLVRYEQVMVRAGYWQY